jgi:hypothetical protein
MMPEIRIIRRFLEARSPAAAFEPEQDGRPPSHPADSSTVSVA